MAEGICPWWLGYVLASPVRRLWQKPEAILQPYVKEGMTVLEVGPGMGFFTLPMARMVGNQGRVVCVDVQERMLRGLARRAQREHLEERIVPIVARGSSLEAARFAGTIDLAVLIAVVHEVPDHAQLFREVHSLLRPSAIVLVSEPAGHVTLGQFDATLTLARQVGFEVIDTPAIGRMHSATLSRAAPGGTSTG